MKQYMLRLGLPRGVNLGANEFREGVAKVLDQEDHGELFHYQEGRTINGKPPCRFVGGKGFVGFVSERSEADIQQIMLPAIKAFQLPKLMEATNGKSPKIQVLEFDKRAFITHEPRVYRVTRCIDKKDRAKLGEEGRLTVLFKSMLRQAVSEGLLPMMPDPEDLQLAFAGIRDLGLETRFNNGGKKWLHMMHAEFIANIDLQGVWQMGGLTSRGHGLIYKQNRKGIFQACI